MWYFVHIVQPSETFEINIVCYAILHMQIIMTTSVAAMLAVRCYVLSTPNFIKEIPAASLPCIARDNIFHGIFPSVFIIA